MPYVNCSKCNGTGFVSLLFFFSRECTNPSCINGKVWRAERPTDRRVERAMRADANERPVEPDKRRFDDRDDKKSDGDAGMHAGVLAHVMGGDGHTAHLVGSLTDSTTAGVIAGMANAPERKPDPVPEKASSLPVEEHKPEPEKVVAEPEAAAEVSSAPDGSSDGGGE